MSVGILNGNVTGLHAIRASLTPTGVSTVTAPEQTFTVAGLRTTDLIIDVTPPSEVAGVAAVYGRVSAANTLAIKFVNPTAGTVTPAAGNYVFTVLRFEGTQAPTVISD